MAAMPPTPEALIVHGDFLRGLARSMTGRVSDITVQPGQRRADVRLRLDR